MAGHLRYLIFLGLAFPVLMSPGLAIPRYDNTQEREMSKLDDGLVFPRSITAGPTTGTYAEQQHHPARLSRRTNSGDEEAQRRQQEERARREEIQRERERQHAANMRLLEHLQQESQQLRDELIEDGLLRPNEQDEARRLTVRRPRWRRQNARRQGRQDQQWGEQDEQQRGELTSRVEEQMPRGRRRPMRAPGEAEFLVGLPHALSMPQDYIRLPIEQARRFDTCAALLKSVGFPSPLCLCN